MSKYFAVTIESDSDYKSLPWTFVKGVVQADCEAEAKIKLGYNLNEKCLSAQEPEALKRLIQKKRKEAEESVFVMLRECPELHSLDDLLKCLK